MSLRWRSSCPNACPASAASARRSVPPVPRAWNDQRQFDLTIRSAPPAPGAPVGEVARERLPVVGSTSAPHGRSPSTLGPAAAAAKLNTHAPLHLGPRRRSRTPWPLRTRSSSASSASEGASTKRRLGVEIESAERFGDDLGEARGASSVSRSRALNASAACEQMARRGLAQSAARLDAERC